MLPLDKIIYFCFFLSGFASLIYELTWIRLLRNVFGSDNLAFSTLLALFIGGMALGNFLSGNLIERISRCEPIKQAKFLIRIYFFIELIIGIYALFTPFLLSAENLVKYLSFFTQIDPENLLINYLSKFIIASFILLLPSTIIGTSYPLLVELLVKIKTGCQRLIGGNLFAINTIGSIAGALTCGFFLMPEFGLSKSILIASCLNFFIVVLIILPKQSSLSLIEVNNSSADFQLDQKNFNYLLVVGFLLGFVNLALEVVWNKVVASLIGSSNYSATIVVSMVLAGLSIGAYAFNLLSKRIPFSETVLLKIFLYFFIASIVFSQIILGFLPGQSISTYLIVPALIFFVTFIEGMSFALVLYIASHPSINELIGIRVAKVSYWNTIGAISGSLLAGLFITYLLPFSQGKTENILFKKQGLNNMVSVIKDQGANAIFLKIDNRSEAGIPIDFESPSRADMVTQTLLGVLPILVKPEAKNSCIIGMGSGITLEKHALAGQVNKLQTIDICEIEKEVFVAADKFFTREYPKAVVINRLNLDARSHLLLQSYDIIISQPSDPWASGSLFTREFWQLAKRKLNENGVFVQWLQLYSVDQKYLEIILSTFKNVFSNVYIFKSGVASELILIGANQPINFNLPAIEKTINDPRVNRALSYIAQETSGKIFANLLLLPEDVKSIKAMDNTDDNMLLEYHTSNHLTERYTTVKSNLKFLASKAKQSKANTLFGKQNSSEINFEDKSLEGLKRAINVCPYNKEAQFLLANIYLERLPSSQEKFFAILKSSQQDDLSHALKYLSNTLIIDPNHLEANYQMLNLQHKIGNLELTLRYLQNLKNLCQDSQLCQKKLTQEQFKQYDYLLALLG